ncbi:MAG: ion transporter [Chlorobi bacterium]|nr:ion transporter [Chlorobiota bacterium]
MTYGKKRKRLHDIIFEADTPAGKLFDVLLLVAILVSVIVVMLDSVDKLNINYGLVFYYIEWVLTILFTIEYALRIIAVKKPSSYIFSFYGVIDLLAILPTYISLFIMGSHYLIVIRILRLLRVFRVLKLMRYVGAADTLRVALKQSMSRIIVFFEVVVVLVVIIGSLMYLIEGPENGFTSIPKAIYWAIVTVTTVGYGDIAPQTVSGQTLASLLMITGYAIIAVPTGVITIEMGKVEKQKKIGSNTQICRNCGYDRHDDDAVFCKHCGEKL